MNGQLKNKYGDAFIRGNNGARAIARASNARETGAFERATDVGDRLATREQCSTSAR